MAGKHIRTTIYLTPQQKDALDELSDRVNITTSELMRRSYDLFLRQENLDLQFPTFSGQLNLRSY